MNSFGYGGSNVHAILEEPGSFTKPTHIHSFTADMDAMFEDEGLSLTSTRPYLLPLSANDDQSLQNVFLSLKQHFMMPQVKVDLEDLCYTLSERRSHLYYRGYVITSSPSLDGAALVRGKKNTNPPTIGFVFTGQGAQWSQMGKTLLETFPSCKPVLEELDETLQNLPHAPTKLTNAVLDELTQPRSPEALRQPEFSQPLVTALQILLVHVLRQWKVTPRAVVGHSSGEIAAAYTAGFITRADAITAAFYRGLAAKRCPVDGAGMLAAGISAAEFPEYTDGLCDVVSIACFNSPQSITISGPVTALEKVKEALLENKKFARLLQVDLAYHSRYMTDIGNDYETLLSESFTSRPMYTGVSMFSSVTGAPLSSPTDVAYWKANMVSPVLFDQAMNAMLSSDSAPSLIIEIGPSGALAGPIAQIKKSREDSSVDHQYCTALSRGRNATQSTFDVAGKLFIAGGDIDLAAVNQYASRGNLPNVIVDLPNYSWNHSTRYWYENESSKDWRFRLFPHHDLLGTKLLGSSWNEPSFKKILRIESLPWLKDHKVSPCCRFESLCSFS